MCGEFVKCLWILAKMREKYISYCEYYSFCIDIFYKKYIKTINHKKNYYLCSLLK